MSKERFHLLGGGVRAELEEPEVGQGEFSRVGGRLPGRLCAGGGLTCRQGWEILLTTVYRPMMHYCILRHTNSPLIYS